MTYITERFASNILYRQSRRLMVMQFLTDDAKQDRGSRII